MVLSLLLLACLDRPAAPPAQAGLSAEGQASRERLKAALEARDPATVSEAARAADAFRGQDDGLDVLLGDALANVLMRPEQGWPLLMAHPAPQDPAWATAVRGAAIRSGDPVKVEAAWAKTGAPDGRMLDAILQVAHARALKDPHFDLSRVDEANADCALVLQRPTLGSYSLVAAGRASLLDAARALGATEIALARPVVPSDPDPLLGNPGPWRCADWALLDGDAWPAELPPRMLLLAATDGRDAVFLSVRDEGGAPTVFNTSVAEWGARWTRAADLFDAAGGGSAGAGQVRQVLGTGLRGVAFPKESP